VKLWLSSIVSPNLLEPDAKLSVKYVTDELTIYCCAVKLPITCKLLVIIALPVTINVVPS